MPKAALYRLSWDPEQGSYILHGKRSERTLPVAPNSYAWFDWLAGIPSFTFSGQHGQLTVRQETRSGSTYWYAYRRVGEKMAKRYLGRTAELTPAHLEDVAREVTALSAFHATHEPLASDPALEPAYQSPQASLSSHAHLCLCCSASSSPPHPQTSKLSTSNLSCQSLFLVWLL